MNTIKLSTLFVALAAVASSPVTYSMSWFGSKAEPKLTQNLTQKVGNYAKDHPVQTALGVASMLAMFGALTYGTNKVYHVYHARKDAKPERVKGTPKLEVYPAVMLLIHDLILGKKTLEEAKEELPDYITDNKQNKENAEYILTEVARALKSCPLPEGKSYSTWPNPPVKEVEDRIAAVDLVLNRITGKTYNRLRLE